MRIQAEKWCCCMAAGASSLLPPLLLSRRQPVLVLLQHELGLVPGQPTARTVCAAWGQGMPGEGIWSTTGAGQPGRLACTHAQ